MNVENRQIIESYLEDGDIKKEAEEWGAARVSYQRGLEEFRRLREEDPEVIITPDDEILRKQFEKRVGEMDSKLARCHLDWGKTAIKNRAYARAVDELEEAMRLASELELAFLEEAKQLLDKARIKLTDHQFYQEITPFVDRGDSFRRSGNHAEAILEYQEGLKRIAGLPTEHRFVGYLRAALRECRRHLIKPYLARIYRAMSSGKFRQAFSVLKRGQLLIDEHDTVYRAFLEQIRLDLLQRQPEVETIEPEEFETPETWSKAVQDYEEALDLYSSFTLNDPLSPVYSGTNVYEDRFVSSRRNLGKLYKNRADHFRDQAKIEKALRNYKEALKLLPRSDQLFHDTFREMKKLRGQLAEPAVGAPGESR
jgi:tetratricopeptide (TPR) repeat protein